MDAIETTYSSDWEVRRSVTRVTEREIVSLVDQTANTGMDGLTTVYYAETTRGVTVSGTTPKTDKDATNIIV